MFQAILRNLHVLAVIHRRAGKDIFCVEAWLLRALMRVGTHAYLFPLQKQARSVIWDGMDFDGRPFLAAIPECLIDKKNEARMEITLINGSKMILLGSNNYDGLMGTNPVTLIHSEYSLHNPLARQYLNPILIQNKGLEILQYTPRGMNHGYTAYQQALDQKELYHVEHLSIEQTFKHDGKTRIITEEDIRRAKALGMSDEMIRQEFYCDFEVGNVGSYFTTEMADMRREGRISTLRPNPYAPLHSVWDLGGTDATAGLLFQIDGKYINVLMLLHDTGKGLKHYLELAEKFRQSIGCQWGNHFMPHDVKQQHQGWEHTESRIMQARKHGWHFQLVPRVNFEDGIEAMRYVLPRTRLDATHCAQAVRALSEYQRKFDEDSGSYSKTPLDTWAVHIADSFRYLSLIYRRLFDIPIPPSKYQSSLSQ